MTQPNQPNNQLSSPPHSDLKENVLKNKVVRPTSILIPFVLAALVLIALAATGTINAFAAAPTIKPDCTALPICGYLQAHSQPDFFSILFAENNQPGEVEPQLTVSMPAFVYSGPGNNYFIYGYVPFGYNSLVVGVSQDRQWWVIPLPISLAPDGLGWIEVSSVHTHNIAVTPVPDPACVAIIDCGYLVDQSQSIDASLQSAFGSQPIYGYLAAHSQNTADSLQSAYGSQPIYGYLRAHTLLSVPILQPSAVGISLASHRSAP